DISHGGEMVDDVDAARRMVECLLVHNIDAYVLNVVPVRRAHVVQDTHLEMLVAQLVDDVRSDESGASGYRYFHCTSTATRSSASAFPSESTTNSASASDMTADVGRQMWRAQR